MKRRVLRWYDYSWSRGRIQGGGDINTALGLLPDKLKTELALHVNLSVLKKVTSYKFIITFMFAGAIYNLTVYLWSVADGWIERVKSHRCDCFYFLVLRLLKYVFCH